MIETIKIKNQVKEALQEFFNEDNIYLRTLVGNIMEDIALGKAIEEGDIGDFVEEKLILERLQGL